MTAKPYLEYFVEAGVIVIYLAPTILFTVKAAVDVDEDEFYAIFV